MGLLRGEVHHPRRASVRARASRSRRPRLRVVLVLLVVAAVLGGSGAALGLRLERAGTADVTRSAEMVGFAALDHARIALVEPVRTSALGKVDVLDGAVLAAASAGVDASAERAAAAAARRTVQAAQTTAAIHAAVQDVPQKVAALTARIDAKRAADAAKAAEEAARAAEEAARARMAADLRDLATRLGITGLGTGKVIVISLAQQRLTAYEDGSVFLTTVVTTGRPELPTVTGQFRVYSKFHPFTFYSEWPPGSPFWFEPSTANYAMFFVDGYAIHDAPWRAAYGPGTEANGSHGCVNVPFSPMQRLFPWTPIGTRVIVY